MNNASVGKSSPTGLYVLAVLLPIVGVIWGIVWWTAGDTVEKREWGKVGFFVAIVVWVVCALAISALAISAMGQA